MSRRLFDLVGAAIGLVLAAPILVLAALGIALTSAGPILYRAVRVGRHGRPFTMFKLRTMHLDQQPGRSRITATHDSRVFPLGRVLRAAKIDELPQLLNVLRGEMSLVGPRPEDPDFVRDHYAPEHLSTLDLRPGLSSPGTLYYETEGAGLLADDAEAVYLDQVLPVKLALDLVYVRRPSLRYDLAIVLRTIWVIVAKLLGVPLGSEQPEAREAAGLVVPTRGQPPFWSVPGRDRRRRPRPTPTVLTPDLRRAP